jgi:hypothetical protein
LEDPGDFVSVSGDLVRAAEVLDVVGGRFVVRAEQVIFQKCSAQH